MTHSYLLTEDYRVFDHDFFGIHPKEAESMDPQQRLLLETVYEGIEVAGYSMDKLRGSSTAIYVGQMSGDYHDMLLRDIDNLPQYTGTGTSRAIMANRISYFFDWRGPSMNIDTACSSSLVALHQAVHALRRGESNLAVAAGVNLILGPESYITGSKVRITKRLGLAANSRLSSFTCSLPQGGHVVSHLPIISSLIICLNSWHPFSMASLLFYFSLSFEFLLKFLPSRKLAKIDNFSVGFKRGWLRQRRRFCRGGFETS